jgi:acetyl esterase/lipase
MQVCGYDPLRDEDLIYEKVLREEGGVKTRVNVYPGLPHLFWIAFKDKVPREAAAAKQDFLDGIAWLLRGGKD